jgi:DNA-binding XRE family transcriptional regulator
MIEKTAWTSLRAIVAIDRLVAERPAPSGFPEHPQTLGEYIKQHRLRNNLLQKDLAKTFKVNETTITNWENNHNEIQTRYLPKVIDFLGFTPEIIKDFKPLQSEVFLTRCELGLTQQQMALRLGIDKTTLHALEWGTRNANKVTQEKINSSLLELRIFDSH